MMHEIKLSKFSKLSKKQKMNSQNLKFAIKFFMQNTHRTKFHAIHQYDYIT